jgi:2-C-methyl-D-erythritol 4-phosphate cytidylyltransferase
VQETMTPIALHQAVATSEDREQLIRVLLPQYFEADELCWKLEELLQTRLKMFNRPGVRYILPVSSRDDD